MSLSRIAPPARTLSVRPRRTPPRIAQRRCRTSPRLRMGGSQRFVPGSSKCARPPACRECCGVAPSVRVTDMVAPCHFMREPCSIIWG
ncbi:hypothetical protein HMPREF9946_01807 [Acetobacteraceae bacterium AT-5844]|nr:hypothetical protein HMPREF9946_01807 [Acetobacteraceae bacterium AT-5844]